MKRYLPGTAIFIAGVYFFIPHFCHITYITADQKSEITGNLLGQLAETLSYYQIDVGDCPPQDIGLNALLQKPELALGWNGPYLKRNVLPRDGWGNEFIYQRVEGECTIISLGADGKVGGENDNSDMKTMISDPG